MTPEQRKQNHVNFVQLVQTKVLADRLQSPTTLEAVSAVSVVSDAQRCKSEYLPLASRHSVSAFIRWRRAGYPECEEFAFELRPLPSHEGGE